MIVDGIRNEWQRRWDESNKGRCTYRFINDMGGIVRAPWVDLSYRITSFLSGHGFFRAKLNELGLEEHPECGCGSDQTAEHLLMNCRITANCREMVLGNVIPDSENEESFEKFTILVGLIFDMHERQDL